MFSLNSRIRPSFLGLEVQLTIQPAVLDRGRHLAGDGGQQREVLAVERLVGLLAAEREHGNRRAFEHARHEVVDARVAPELDFFGDEARGGNRIVERDGVAAVEPRQHRRAARQPRHALCEPVVADRREVAEALVGEHQRHAIDDERLDDARDEPLAEADDVEVAVQIAREADERAAVVVAIAVEHAIERVLHGFLHRLREQHDDDRGEQPRRSSCAGRRRSAKMNPASLRQRDVERHAGAAKNAVYARPRLMITSTSRSR